MKSAADILKKRDFQNLKVTVMGLGLNGGGLASALFFAKHGAEVTVTDLRDEKILKPSIDQLSGYKINYTLGKHLIEDFKNADIVIKNPAVNPDSEYLKVSKQIETDLSVFLSICQNPVIAVTGSKGKSTTVSAIFHIVKSVYKNAKLGGNITTSPLTFIDEISPETPVILELSSWQLADIKERNLLKPKVAVITNILPDHLNRYRDMAEYVEDKKLIYKDQLKTDFTLCNFDDNYGKIFASETPGTAIYFSENLLPDNIKGVWLEKNQTGYININQGKEQIVPEKVKLQGIHNRKNLLIAGAAAYLFGISPDVIRKQVSEFGGIPHRMEFLCIKNRVSFYNDTTATIPEAVIAAAESFTTPVRLISGGTDKNLDFAVFKNLKGKTEKLYLLEGSATDKMLPFLNKYKISWSGPFNNLEDAVSAAFNESNDNDVIILSPGCTSFGMFKNEFDRGEKFRQIVKSLQD